MNSRGWNPRIGDPGIHDPAGVEESAVTGSCSTPFRVTDCSGSSSRGLHPRLFRLLPSGESSGIGYPKSAVAQRTVPTSLRHGAISEFGFYPAVWSVIHKSFCNRLPKAALRLPWAIVMSSYGPSVWLSPSRASGRTTISPTAAWREVSNQFQTCASLFSIIPALPNE